MFDLVCKYGGSRFDVPEWSTGTLSYRPLKRIDTRPLDEIQAISIQTDPPGFPCTEMQAEGETDYSFKSETAQNSGASENEKISDQSEISASKYFESSV